VTWRDYTAGNLSAAFGRFPHAVLVKKEIFDKKYCLMNSYFLIFNRWKSEPPICGAQADHIAAIGVFLAKIFPENIYPQGSYFCSV
jgi:hypothetical protein